jgi:cobalamin synthase
MKNKNLGLYAVALAILVVGLLWAGLPVTSLVWFGLVLACPLMMFFMMRGMHGAHSQQHPASPRDDRFGSDQPDDHHHTIR